MPNWKIHLKIAKTINKQVKYNNNDFTLFLIGNILPDINNCYVIKNISKKLSHNYTHYKSFNKKGHLYFLEKYKTNIKNPLIFGYFCHLLTDFIWNNYCYAKLNNLFDNLSKNEIRILKQNEFTSYNNFFEKNKLEVNIDNDLITLIKKIDRISITHEDLEKCIYYINQNNSNNNKLKYFSKEELDDLLKKSINQTLDYYNNL